MDFSDPTITWIIHGKYIFVNIENTLCEQAQGFCGIPQGFIFGRGFQKLFLEPSEQHLLSYQMNKYLMPQGGNSKLLLFLLVQVKY